MRPVALPSPGFDQTSLSPVERWLVEAVRSIALASHDQVTEQTADAYTITNLTASRTLDCDAATTAELADVVGTLLADMKNRGPKRG